MQYTDLAVVQAEKEGGTLKVEQVRALRQSLVLKPYQGKYRLALFLRFQEANANSANALLKTLEEAPSHVIIILTADSPEQLLPTIVSRCEVLRLRPVPVEAVEEFLLDHGAEKDSARLLAHVSGGRPGYALRLMQDPKALDFRSKRLEDLSRLLKSTLRERFAYAEKLTDRKKEADEQFRETLQVWLSFWRDVLLCCQSRRRPADQHRPAGGGGGAGRQTLTTGGAPTGRRDGECGGAVRAQRQRPLAGRSFVDGLAAGIKWFLTLNRYYKYLAIFTLLLASCQAKPVDTPTPTWTVAPTNTATLTPTTIPTATPTPRPTLIPEPTWYRGVDPSFASLKYQYAEVINERARVYATFEDALAKNGNFGYLPNFPAYIAHAASRVTDDGQTYYQDQINYGWIAAEDLKPLTSSSFSGVEITRDIPFRFGWVLTDTVAVGADDQPGQTYKRYQLVYEVPTSASKSGYIAVGESEWLPEASVALVDPAVPPDAGPNTCRFIYANIKTQTLSVYDQCKLVFATLLSSGKNSWTFEGRFAILYKVEYSSITPPAELTSEYYIEGVPYFMTYAGNFGFHGAYWHDAFGTAASHGCINLSPADAKWLYLWAGLGERVIISAGE